MARKLDHVFHDILETIARVEEITRGVVDELPRLKLAIEALASAQPE
jgi:hypothetical protein